MSKQDKSVSSYGNWVSDKLIGKIMIVFSISTMITVLLFVLPKSPGIAIHISRAVMIVISAFFLISSVYLFVARHLFSYTGGNLQKRVLDEIIDRIEWDGEGKALDIGCGSGALTIALAKKHGNAEIVGLDYWGKNWDYDKTQCETNAIFEKVERNTRFVQGSASRLPFEDNSFDLVVSNMTFHEVGDSENKFVAIREAVRVLKKGKTFVFQDLFKLKAYYGSTDDLIRSVKEMGVREVFFVDISKMDYVPAILKLPFMLGTAGLLFGKK